MAKGLGTEFRYGLPVSDFVYALGWRQKAPSVRDPTFPSWSWAAYEGELLRGAIDAHLYPGSQLADDERPFWWPYFRMGEFRNSEFVALSERSRETDHRDPWADTARDVELLKIENLNFEDDAARLDQRTIKEGAFGPGPVVVEGIILTIHLHELATVSNPEAKLPFATFKVLLDADSTCTLFTPSAAHADVVYSKGRGGGPLDCLVLQRTEFLNEVLYDLLMLEWRSGVAYRVDCVFLKVEGVELHKITELMPRRKRFSLG